jgi:hypothetical protein
MQHWAQRSLGSNPPKPSGVGYRLAAAATAAAVVSVCVTLAWPIHGLEVRTDEGCVLFLPLRKGEAVELIWRHSVDGIEVRDRFQRRGDMLTLVSSQTPYFASGLGQIRGRGRVVDAGGHALAVIDIDEPVDPLPLRVGSAEVGHRLHHRGRDHDLSRGFAGRRLLLGVTPRPRASAWWGCHLGRSPEG